MADEITILHTMADEITKKRLQYMKWKRWRWLGKYARLKEESFICLYERILLIGETVWFLRIKNTVSKIMRCSISY